jgi:two-component system sensor histidine kinase AlgZ
VVLGALAGLYACAMLSLVGVASSRPGWPARPAARCCRPLVAALVLRARGRTPAATTARLTELQSRIRPHFLFNTLNSAIALVREEPAKAESLLEDLSDLFRHALVEQGEAVTLAEEITLARRYLAIEEVRFGKRLQVQWSLDPRTDNARLPPLLLQPLVENAVKHGVEPSARGGKLRVLTELRGSRVVVRITNTLPPRKANTARATSRHRGHGIALANVRARLALLHDVQGEFSAGVQDGLYQVRITLPAPRRAQARRPCARTPNPGPRRSSAMNILIVDDEALARSRLRTLLGDCQDTVRTTVAEAANAGEALAQLTPTGGRALTWCCWTSTCPARTACAWPTPCRPCPTRPPWCL